MINLFTTSGFLGESLQWTLNGIFMFIDRILYSFVSFAYQVFVAISRANLFTESTLKTITDRVFTILGVVMLFIMAYEILMLIINPDKLTGESGAKRLVTKVLTSIVLITLLPTIYKYMQIFQDDVLTSNVIGNIVLGSTTTQTSDYSLESAGTSMALSITQAFFHPTIDGEDYSYQRCLSDAQDNSICKAYIEAYDYSFETNRPAELLRDSELNDATSISPFESFGNRFIPFVDNKVEMVYIPILSTIAAIMALRMIIAFSLDIGVRVAKLGFLQVIAPIPIAMNITEKQSIMSSKWFQSLKGTYLDIFMKLIIIYFCMFAITLVPEVISNLWWDSDGGFFVQMLASVVVILGILQFAKDGPKLIKDLFNIDLDFSIKKRLNENTYAMRGFSMLGGAGKSFGSNMYNKSKKLEKEDPSGSKSKRLGKSLLSGIGGAGSGFYRGFRESKDIKDINELKGITNKVREQTDDAASARDGRRIRDKKYAEAFTDNFGNVVSPIAGPAGVVAGKAEAIKDGYIGFKKRSKRWFEGNVSDDKRKHAESGRDSIKGFVEGFTSRDDYLSSLKEAYQKGLNELNLKSYVNPEVLESFKAENSERVSGMDDAEIIKNYKKEIAKHMDKETKRKSSERIVEILNDSKEKQEELFNMSIEKLTDTLNKNFKGIGTEIGTKILEKGGFDSMKALEKAIENMGSDSFTADDYNKIIDVSKAFDTQAKIQISRQMEEAAKESSSK